VGALIPGFVAKEVVVGALGVSFLGAEPAAGLGLLAGLHDLALAFLEALKETLGALLALFGLPRLGLEASVHAPALRAPLSQALTPKGALAYLVFVLLYTPCVATLSALRQELGRRWAAFSLAYQLTLAYLAAFLTARLFP